MTLTWLVESMRPVAGSTSQKLIWMEDLSLAPIKRLEAEHFLGITLFLILLAINPGIVVVYPLDIYDEEQVLKGAS